MLLIVFALVLLFFILVVVLAVRALILCPVAIFRQGWRVALLRYPLSAGFIFLLLAFEFGNLTGFSWTRLRYVSHQEIADAAVRYSYPDIYADARALRKDYSHFEPKVRYWGNGSSQVENGLVQKLFGVARYEVRLPEEIVMVNVDGKAEFSRGLGDCPSDNGCPPALPDNPERGVVGTVQLGQPDYPVAKDLLVRWQDGKGSPAFVSGHCFSIHRHSTAGGTLRVTAPGGVAATIRPGAGFYLVAVTGGGHSFIRISKAVFLRSRSCDPAIRKDWPNVGGWSWKR